jgi:hypothetical protein
MAIDIIKQNQNILALAMKLTLIIVFLLAQNISFAQKQNVYYLKYNGTNAMAFKTGIL